MILSERVIQVGLQVFNIPEFFEFTSIERSDADASRSAQSVELGRRLRLALLHQPQPVIQHFAGVLVAARPDKALDQLFLALGQRDISDWHRCSS